MIIGQSYAKSVISDNERIIFVQRPHWLAYLPAILWIIIPVLGWVIALGILVKQFSTEIVITDRRLIVKRGFISRKTEELSLNKMEEVNLDQSVLGRILDYGNVSIEGTGLGKIRLDFIDSPALFIKKLNSNKT